MALDRVLDALGVLLELGERLSRPLRLGGARKPLGTRLTETLRDLGDRSLEALALQRLHDRAKVLAALARLPRSDTRRWRGY
jgi:hypothetical protein